MAASKMTKVHSYPRRYFTWLGNEGTARASELDGDFFFDELPNGDGFGFLVTGPGITVFRYAHASYANGRILSYTFAGPNGARITVTND